MTQLAYMWRKIKKWIIAMTFALIIFLIITVLIPYLSFTFTTRDFDRKLSDKIAVVAHRGASGYAPENTLASFRKALEMGADVIELDVHLTRDDSIVVMHDYHVARTTDGKGEIGQLSFNEIRGMDAGSWFSPEFKQEKVPTLHEVLKMADGKAKVLVELKWPSRGIYPKLVDKVVEEIRRHDAASWVILQSFEEKYLVQLEQVAPDLVVHQLLFGTSGILPIYFNRGIRYGKFTPATTIRSVNLFYIYANKRFIEEMHKMGKSVYVFTVNDTTVMKKAFALQVDGIITNFPDKALKLLGR